MTLIKETDFGTPKVNAEKMVTLEIDGQAVTVPEGTSIMHAAMGLGTKKPKLCATDSLNSFGSCRLCLVEIEGRITIFLVYSLQTSDFQHPVGLPTYFIIFTT